MQRDFDLVVTILGTFRDAAAATLTGQEVTKAVQELAEDDLSAATVEHHLEILADAGLAKKLTEGPTGQDAVWRITWKGYDALEQDDEDEEEEEEDDDLEYDEE
ncbi:helix-turn-helix domain-containing protein [Bordetella sp. LUAb4]|uniref:helix-turn-helix domain-containing protein n=1 Tax=Bordetella sp. LUAb4 TaxID=2843195 RepID=UPI001E2D1E26|nr:helix-turn-helix domain-containing protein [Bordetella sp. LUAb4]